MKTRVCTKCEVRKPNTLEFFFKARESLSAWCKLCYSNFRRAHIERYRIYNARWVERKRAAEGLPEAK